MPYKIGTRWKAQVRMNGEKKEKRFRTRKEAIDWETEMRKKIEDDCPMKTDTDCLNDWAQLYLDFAKIKFSVKTYKEKKSMFKRFFKVVKPEQHPRCLKPATVLSYVTAQAEERSGYAANKDRKNLVAAWNWGMKYMERPLPGPNPCIVERMPEVRHPRYMPREQDFWRVYDVAEGQDKVMLLAFLHLAARRGEIFRLTWPDVDFGNSRIRLGTRKRRDGNFEYDWLPMTDELFSTLLAHKQQSTSGWVFLNPQSEQPYVDHKKWMPRLCRKAVVKPFGMHAIRHLTASILAQNGVPTITIQAILRHKKISTTERYLHRLEDLKPALTLLTTNKKPPGEPPARQTAKTQIRIAL